MMQRALSVCGVGMWAVDPLPGVQVQVCDDEPGAVSVDIWRAGGRGLRLGPMTAEQVEKLMAALREACETARQGRTA